MKEIMDWIIMLNSRIIWGPPMIALMLGTGIFLTICTGGILFRKMNIVLRYTIMTLFRRKAPENADKGAITPFQAVCTALAGTVGTGNIVGVALAIATGGPGAIFWLWISALAGMVIKYCEVTLSVAYRTRNSNGEPVGGPMYYIRSGLGWDGLAKLFALSAAIAAFGVGAAVQGNSIAGSMHSSFHIPAWLTGLALTFLAALVLLGGIQRIAGITELLVPFMAVFYIGGSLVVLFINRASVPEALQMIFQNAFTGTAASGGFLGATVMQACRTGIARGVFTHEAGIGSAPIAHACADTDHPARQGLWGAFEVFFDSILLCTITALVILTSGLWKSNLNLTESALSSLAFDTAFPGGQYIVTISLALFAFATIIAWYYYGAQCVTFLFPRKPRILQVYPLAYVGAVFLGSIAKLDIVWAFADLFNGLMAIPNLIALILLSPAIRRLSRDLFSDPHRLRPKGESFDCFLIKK